MTEELFGNLVLFGLMLFIIFNGARGVLMDRFVAISRRRVYTIEGPTAFVLGMISVVSGIIFVITAIGMEAGRISDDSDSIGTLILVGSGLIASLTQVIGIIVGWVSH